MSDVARTDRGHWRPGVSGNQNGRPPGRGNQFEGAFKRDLAAKWAESGADVLNRVAATEPARFLAICASLIPKDVQVSLQARLPGNLQAEDWQLVTEMLEAVRQGMPDAGEHEPGDVLEFVLQAIRSHSAKLIAPDAGNTDAT